MAQGKPHSCSADIFSFTLANCKVIGNLSWLLINTENNKSSMLFWETTVYLEWVNEGMKYDTSSP